VERLMRGMGLRGAVRGRAYKVTTVADESALRPQDLVQREFVATKPSQLWVADFSKPRFLARQFLVDFHSVAVANKKFTMSSFAAGSIAKRWGRKTA
jgi:transposase InsO family protein